MYEPNRQYLQSELPAEIFNLGSGSNVNGQQVIVNPNGTRSFVGAGGGTGTQVPAFKFDYESAEAEALKSLEPYYAQKLAEAGGDIERAKRLIEEDYATGKRQRDEDLTTALSADDLSVKEEKDATIDSLNQRGVLFGGNQAGDTASGQMPFSGLAQQDMGNLQTRQQARRMAIQRAIQRQEEVAQTERKRGVEEQDIAFPRYERALHQEKLDKARFNIVPYYRDKAYARYQGSFNPYMQGDQL